jgi:hypothetical protein
MVFGRKHVEARGPRASKNQEAATMQHAILPEGEHVRRAVRWISDQRREGPGQNSLKLVGEASFRFDLSPLEEEWLLHTFALPRSTP